MRRVVITGMGALTGAGPGVGASWAAVRQGSGTASPAGTLSHLGFRSPVSRLRGFDPSAVLGHRKAQSLDPVAQYAMVAAREAMSQAGLPDHAGDPYRIACFLGSAAGPQTAHDEAARRIYVDRSERVHPLTLPRCMFSAAASQVAMDLGIRGTVLAIASACASATHALGQALHHIRMGLADIALAGGSEACLTRGCLASWSALPVLTKDLCRPFSAGRSGIVLAEGAAMLVLEDAERAERRGARPLAELIGFGASSDAGTLTGADADGMARAMANALRDCGLGAQDIDHVNAHGTGTVMNDATETEALRKVFGKRLSNVPITANKSTLGHMLGASGAIELIMSIVAMHEGFIPPTANFSGKDPQCELDCVPNEGRDARPATILSNSFAFGGLNASLVVRHA